MFCELRLAGLRQRVDSSLMEMAHFRHMPRLIRKAADENLIGAVGQIDRCDQENGFPMFTTSDDHGRNRTGTTQTATVPTALERAGDFSQSVQRGPVAIYDPLSGLPFPGNVIPQNRISPIAAKLAEREPGPSS